MTHYYDGQLYAFTMIPINLCEYKLEAKATCNVFNQLNCCNLQTHGTSMTNDCTRPIETVVTTKLPTTPPTHSLLEVCLTLHCWRVRHTSNNELTTASNHHMRQLVQQWDQLTIKDGILHHNWQVTLDQV